LIQKVLKRFKQPPYDVDSAVEGRVVRPNSEPVRSFYYTFYAKPVLEKYEQYCHIL